MADAMKDKMGSVLSCSSVPLKQGVAVVGVTADLTSRRETRLSWRALVPKCWAARAAVAVPTWRKRVAWIHQKEDHTAIEKALGKPSKAA